MSRSGRWLVLAAVAAAGVLGYGLLEQSLPVQLLAAGAITAAVVQGSRPAFVRWLELRRAEQEVLRWQIGSRIDGDALSSPAGLLAPRLVVVPFAGRRQELEDLIEWCTGDNDRKVRLITGPGGVGKSRLAHELAQRLAGLGWSSFEVPSRREADILRDVRGATSGRVLLVVDYAETRAHLSALLDAASVDNGRRVRVLLLARSVGEWWERLTAHSAVTRELLRRSYDNTDLSVDLKTDHTNDTIVKEAAAAFAGRLGVAPVPDIHVVSRPGRTRILDLHAAALVGVLKARASGAAAAVTLPASDVLEELLGHEQHYWYGSAESAGLLDGPHGVTYRAIRQLVAVTSLLGAATYGDALGIVRRVVPEVPAVKIVQWLRELHPPTGDLLWLGNLQPDRVAELHVLRELERSPDLADRCLTGLDTRQALSAMTALVRLTVDRFDEPDELATGLHLVDVAVARLPDDLNTLLAVVTTLPRKTVVLAASTVTLVRRTLDAVPLDDEPLKARMLSELGMRSYQAGYFADALAAETEAVEIHRRLAANDPTTYLPALARSLSILGKWRAYRGDPQAALEAEQESVAIRERLVEHDGASHHRSHLALSLTNLGNWLAWTGHPADAIAPAARATEIRRRLDPEDPVNRRDLGEALSHLAHWYADVRRYDEALPPAREAVALRRELARVDPDLHQSDYSISLSNLGTWLTRRSGVLASDGRDAEAKASLTEGLASLTEAIDLQRRLSREVALRYPFDLAISMSRLSEAQTLRGQFDEALACVDEAITLQRSQISAHPHRVPPYLAHSLCQRGTILIETGNSEQAIAPLAEAVSIHRELHARLPARYGPGLNTALTLSAQAMRALGRFTEADDAVAEAARLTGS